MQSRGDLALCFILLILFYKGVKAMRKLMISAVLIMLLVMPATVFAGRKCTGSKNCTACTTCTGCKHCAKNGGTCGVCTPKNEKSKKGKGSANDLTGIISRWNGDASLTLEKYKANKMKKQCNQ